LKVLPSKLPPFSASESVLHLCNLSLSEKEGEEVCLIVGIFLPAWLRLALGF
jgi:hypothetical protein